jgi:hypothetical protein
MQPTITVTKVRPGMKALANSLELLTRKRVLVGIPATNAMERKRQLMSLAQTMTGKRRRRTEHMAVVSPINNAELLYILSNGSPLKHIPPAPVIEPALTDKQNQAKILPELKAAAQAAMQPKPNPALVERQLKLAGIVAENACKEWFTNPRNNWPPNAPSTIKAKGSSRRNIDTSALRQALTSVVVDSK